MGVDGTTDVVYTFDSCQACESERFFVLDHNSISVADREPPFVFARTRNRSGRELGSHKTDGGFLRSLEV